MPQYGISTPGLFVHQPSPTSSSLPTINDFSYSPLNPDRQEIRLVTILPGNWKDTISCTLRTVSRNENPLYTALSYVWGDANKKKPILLNGKQFEVTLNLWDALRRLRPLPIMPSNATRGLTAEPQNTICTMWIDAICIDQKNDPEKSHQVALMGQIFRNCHEAILWLGEDPFCANYSWNIPPQSPMARQAFKILRSFESDKHLNEMSFLEVRHGSFMDVARGYEEQVQAFISLCNLQWWARIWVVQEAALPPQATFKYASESCLFETLATACENYKNHSTNCCCFVPFPENMWDSAWSLWTNVSELHDARQTIRNGSMLILSLARYKFAHLETTNPRDRIFALLGIAGTQRAADAILPDYSERVEWVFTKSAFAMIMECPDDVLPGRRILHKHSNTPSWIPDWTVSTVSKGTTSDGQLVLGLFKASKDLPLCATLSSNTALIIKAVRFDSLKLIGDCYEKSDNLKDVLQQWMMTVDIESLPETAEQGSKADSFWRTVMADTTFRSDFSFRRIFDKDYSTFLAWYRTASDSISSKDVWRLWGYMYRTCSGRKLFCTRSGNTGLAYKEASVDDEVYIILGCGIPFLLQRREEKVAVEGEDDLIPSFTVIGDCYVHGIMDGEVIQGDWESKVETIALV